LWLEAHSSIVAAPTVIRNAAKEIWSTRMIGVAIGAALVLVGILLAFLWSSFLDLSFVKEPSELLAYAYLAVILGLGLLASPYLDQLPRHPYRSALILAGVLALILWSAVIMWRKAAKWDENFHRRRRQRRRR
jgi:hypothetical protein